MTYLSNTHPLGRQEEDVDGVLAYLGKEMIHYCDLVQEGKETQYRFWLNQRTPELAIGISQSSGRKLRIPIPLSEKMTSYELTKLLLIFDHIIISQETRTDLVVVSDEKPALVKKSVSFDKFDSVLFKQIGNIGDIALYSPNLPQVPGLSQERIPNNLIAGPLSDYILVSGETEIGGRQLAQLRRVGDSYLLNPSWMFNSEYRALIESGMLVLGGTIPGKDIDQECLSRGVDLTKYYGPILFDSHNATLNGIDRRKAEAVLKLDIPVLQGLECDEFSKIINDNKASFMKFRSHLLEGLSQIEDSMDEYDFQKKVKVIKKEIIDDGIDELNRQYDKIRKIRAFRAAGYVVGSMGLWASIYLRMPEVANLFAIGSPLALTIQEQINRLKEMTPIENNECYFLWQIDRRA